MRDYQIGDYVIWIDKGYSNIWKKQHEVSLYGKIAKIIYIDKKNEVTPYLLEFKKYINGHSGFLSNIRGKKDHCKWCGKERFKLALDHLKFKKWIRG